MSAEQGEIVSKGRKIGERESESEVKDVLHSNTKKPENSNSEQGLKSDQLQHLSGLTHGWEYTIGETW